MIDILGIAKNIIENNPVSEVGKDIYSGYSSMSAEEKASFWKNVLITGAKAGAAVG